MIVAPCRCWLASSVLQFRYVRVVLVAVLGIVLIAVIASICRAECTHDSVPVVLHAQLISNAGDFVSDDIWCVTTALLCCFAAWSLPVCAAPGLSSILVGLLCPWTSTLDPLWFDPICMPNDPRSCF